MSLRTRNIVAILLLACWNFRTAAAFSTVVTTRYDTTTTVWRLQSSASADTRAPDTDTVSTTSSSPPSTAADKILDSLNHDVILYDGVCNFCNSWVNLLLRIDVQKKFRFAPLQSQTGQALLVSIGKQADDISSVVLVKRVNTKTGGQRQRPEYYDKSLCVLKVVEELGPVAALASRAALAAVPESIRDGMYDMVAENRYKLMGKRDECRCSDPEFADRFLLD